MTFIFLRVLVNQPINSARGTIVRLFYMQIPLFQNLRWSYNKMTQFYSLMKI